MGILDSQKAFQDGQSGINPPGYTDPTWGDWNRGNQQNQNQNQRERVRVDWKVSEYFGALIGLPITAGLIAGVIALLAGADYLQWGLGWALGAFVLVLAVGVLWVAFRLLIASIVLVIVLAPVALIGALGVYLLSRIGVGPGLPDF